MGATLVCSADGFLAQQNEDLSQIQKMIPGLQRLLYAFRGAGFPVYHTREGKPLSAPH